MTPIITHLIRSPSVLMGTDMSGAGCMGQCADLLENVGALRWKWSGGSAYEVANGCLIMTRIKSTNSFLGQPITLIALSHEPWRLCLGSVWCRVA